MSCSRPLGANALLTKQSAAQVLKSLNGNISATSTSRPAFLALRHQYFSPRRQFSSTPQSQFNKSRSLRMKEFFPTPDAPHIKTTEAAWPHPIYTEEQMNSVVVAHRDARNWSDKVALAMTRVARFGLDLATGYKHDKAVALNKKDPAAARQKYAMTERKYMIRNIFLESIAGEQRQTNEKMIILLRSSQVYLASSLACFATCAPCAA